jgi:soluble lytic murein transglycosylase-like protein
MAALAAIVPSARAASGLAEVIGPDGRLVATASAQAGWAYPADGSVAQVADVTVVAGSVQLTGVTLLGGRVTIAGARAGPGGSVSGLQLDGQPVTADRPNTVIAIPGAGWALVSQQAVIPLRSGRVRTTYVAVRLHLLVAVGGVPAGTDVVIGYVAGRRTAAVLRGAATEIPPALVPIYRAAGRRYGVPWAVLAAINRVETSFGRDLSVSSAGAVGWMQFMPGTWAAYGVDANGDGRTDPYTPEDAIAAAANLLRANGAARDLRGAIFQYNHAWWYVDRVLALAGAYADGAATIPVGSDGPRPGEDENGALWSPIALW